MLKQRIITALILVAILLSSLLADNPLYWRLLISLVVFVGFWEWLRFCSIKGLPQQLLCFILFAIVIGIVQIGLIPMAWLIAVSCFIWVLLLSFTLSDSFSIFHNTIVKLIVGMWILSTAGYFVIELKQIEHGILWILCMMVAIWAADIGAYFIGRRFGKTKLAPSISPGKTVEGLVGGLVLVMLVFVPIMFFNFTGSTAVFLLLTVLLTAFISVGGDLFESKLKRFVSLKDSSQILPGHGGVLDRVDSLLAGIPFFVFGLMALGFLT